MPPSRVTAPAAVLVTALLSGCENFENPLRWEESPLADDLVGSWNAVEGEDAGTSARVSRTDDGALRVELNKPDKNERFSFIADLVASESVHVLQVRMDTYEPKSDYVTESGFRFLRLTLAGDERLRVQRLDGSRLGKVAENVYTGAGLELSLDTVAGCLGEKLTQSLWAKFWTYMSEQLEDDLEASVVAALGDEAASDVEKELAKIAQVKVDPYEELANMRTCIARHLPSESLEQLFLSHTDLVFSGGTDRYERD